MAPGVNVRTASLRDPREAPIGPPRFGVSVELPIGWALRWHPAPRAVDPRGIFTITTQRSELRARCPRLRSNNAIVYLSEEVGEYPPPRALPRMRSFFPHRPARFHVGHLHETQLTCGGCSERLSNVIRFTDHGRFLYFNLVFGLHPSRFLRQQVERFLDSVRVRPAR